MSREAHVRFSEGLGVKFPRATHLESRVQIFPGSDFPKSGLMWEQKTDDGGANDKDNAYTWEGALAWVQGLNQSNYLNHNDWRLPNIKELQSIVDFSRSDPAVNTNYFPNTKSYIYWSSTSVTQDLAWAVWFDYGYVDFNWQYFGGKADQAHVRAVRNATPTYSCIGFQPPCDAGPIKVKKNRVIPLRAVLVDSEGVPVTDATVGTGLPWVKIVRNAGTSDATDVTSDALTAGQGTEGNEFLFSDGKWQYNLSTKNYSSAGTYTVTMESPSASFYLVNPTCTATFVIE